MMTYGFEMFESATFFRTWEDLCVPGTNRVEKKILLTTVHALFKTCSMSIQAISHH